MSGISNATRPRHPKRVYLGLAFALLLLEILIATRFRNHRFIRGSLGDILAPACLYFLSQGLRPGKPPPRLVLVYGFACLVELGQFFHLAGLLHLRPGSVPAILLGSTYSLQDLGMYLVGCVAAWGVERGGLWRVDQRWPNAQQQRRNSAVR